MEILLGQIRIIKNISLMELSYKTGISKSTLNNYENGITAPDLFKLEKIAIGLNSRIMNLFESDWK